MQEATTALTADSPTLPRTGRTYGHSRSSERTEDRWRASGPSAGSGVVPVSGTAGAAPVSGSAGAGLAAGITSRP